MDWDWVEGGEGEAAGEAAVVVTGRLRTSSRRAFETAYFSCTSRFEKATVAGLGVEEEKEEKVEPEAEEDEEEDEPDGSRSVLKKLNIVVGVKRREGTVDYESVSEVREVREVPSSNERIWKTFQRQHTRKLLEQTAN